MLIKKLFLFITLISSLGALQVVQDSQTVQAADLSQFNAGRIIDDQVFFDKSGLSTSEIQSFLNAKVPVCDTWGTQPYGGTTRASYGTSRGYAPPYTCLKDYVQDIGGKPADSFCNGYAPSRKTAAEIIYGVAQSCGINPRALIVLLQKEQGLVTDDWPWSVQYRSATGYGCPDTAPCDAEYYGFFNQVYNAARQFKRYAAYNSEYSYRAFRSNYIQWSPNASCGGSNVYIENYATSGLYIYTPYRPNQAALNAGYGMGDSCSAYGNRNFWLYYTDWFGSTTAPNYWWQPAGQGAYTDDSKVTSKSLNNVIAGTKTFLTVRVKNSGAATWYKNSINLATNAPQNRSSQFADSTWLSPVRPATLKEDSVAPGGYGTFEFWVTAPTKPGVYKEYYTLVAENVTWMNDMGLYFEFNVEPARYTWEPAGQSAYTDATKQQHLNYANLVAGDEAYMSARFKNIGNVTWSKGAINLATNGPQNRISGLRGTGWLSPNRPATLTEDKVAPGETGTVEFWVKAPQQPGTYREYFNLVAENISWMNDLGFYYEYPVKAARYTWEPAGQGAYTDDTMTNQVNLGALQKNQRVYLVVKAKNVGNATWRQQAVNLGTNGPQNRSSKFYDSSWTSPTRPSTLKESVVKPGEVATFGFWVTAPSNSGHYREYFNFVAEYVTWMNDLGLYYDITVN